MQKTFKIGLFGFGCVGQGFYQILANSNLPATITKICVKDPNKQREAPTHLFTTASADILENPDIDIIVELIDNATEALRIVQQALTTRKPVISANKKMIAENMPHLLNLQEKFSTPLLYEGAVCGGIPIISTLDTHLATEEVQEIRGILNGSTNYILSQVLTNGLSYQDALKNAQDHGFAESDPSLDVEGFDPAFKLSILLKHTFGYTVAPASVYRQGITNLTRADIRFATDRGLRIKLVAHATRSTKGISASVAPQFVSTIDPLHNIDNEYNAVIIKGELADNHILVGKGAGSKPTGIAVIGDLNRLIGHKILRQDPSASITLADPVVNVYVGAADIHSLEPLFHEVFETYYEQPQGYIIGKTTLSSLKQIDPAASVIFTTPGLDELQTRKQYYRYA